MGSLMAGWDSPVPDPKYGLSAKFLKNRSFTEREIEDYWRLKKTTDEEHLQSRTLSDIQENSQDESGQKEKGGRRQRSNSLPPANIRKRLTNMDSETDLETTTKKNNAWWTRSNMAFLNEPPVIVTEAPSYKYASHYHLANFSSSRTLE